MSEDVKSEEELTEEQLLAKYSEGTEPEDESPDTPPETVDEPEAEEAEEESPDTEVETAEESPETEVDLSLEAFEELGLNKTYANPAAALRSLKDAQAEIGRLQREQGTREATPPAPPPQPLQVAPEFDADRYNELALVSPLEAQKYIQSFVNTGIKDEISTLKDELAKERTDRTTQQENARAKEVVRDINKFIDSHDDFAAKEGAIANLIETDPYLRQIAAVDPLAATERAYKEVSFEMTPKKVVTEKAPTTLTKTKIAKASTSSGGKSRKTSKSVGEYTKEEFEGMKEKELEAMLLEE